MNDRIADRVKNFDSGKIRQAFEFARDIPNQIDLSIGFPEENTPQLIKDAGIRAINQNHTRYLPTNGLEALRNQISKKLANENDIKVSIDNITVTPGLTTAILLCYLAVLNPGDEILLPQPLFPPYFDLAKLIGAVPVSLDTFPDFQLTADLVKKHITPRTKVLLINSPNNPTGAVYPKEELIKIVEVAKQHNLIIISDEIYEYFSYDKPHFSVGSIYSDVLTLNGFSKAYAMTGWRIGYICGPTDIVEALNQLQQYIVFSSSSIGQYAALGALEGPRPNVGQKYQAKRNLAKQVLGSEFSDIQGGEGAFYLFLKLPNGLTDTSVVNHLAHRGVVVLPGSAFSAYKNYIRISFAGNAKQLQLGLERINESIRILTKKQL